MLTRMYLYSTSTKLSIDVWLYLDRPGSLRLALMYAPTPPPLPLLRPVYIQNHNQTLRILNHQIFAKF